MTLTKAVDPQLFPLEGNRPVDLQKKVWNDLGIQYERSAQETTDDLFEKKVKNTPDRHIEIYRIYRHQTNENKEYITYSYNDVATTNLGNKEINTPSPHGVYYKPETRRQGVMNEDGILESKPVEIRGYESQFYIPYNAENILELTKKVKDQYSVMYIAVPAGGQSSIKVPNAKLLAYMPFERIIACNEGGEGWPLLASELEELKKEYNDKLSSK